MSDIWNIDNIDGVDGIFSILSDGTTYPLVHDFINTDYETLSYDYFIGFSADKWLSPFALKIIEKFTDSSGNIDYTNLSEFLANVIYKRFGVKWKKIYDALMTQYNPLENYNMYEKRTPDLTDERTPDITLTEDNTITTNTDSETSINGFNSTESNPSNDTVGNQTNTIDRTNTETGKETTTHTGKEELERSGNIGVTTSQQMLESEIKLRQYDFYKQIYKDVDSILCLGIY